MDVTAAFELRDDREEGSAARTPVWPQGSRHQLAATLSKVAPKAEDVTSSLSNPARHGRSWEKVFGPYALLS